jgi:D-alanyl-D-alanine carboxypeptidase
MMWTGFSAPTGTTLDGRQATVMVNEGPLGTTAEDDDLDAAVDTALCGAG